MELFFQIAGIGATIIALSSLIYDTYMKNYTKRLINNFRGNMYKKYLKEGLPEESAHMQAGVDSIRLQLEFQALEKLTREKERAVRGAKERIAEILKSSQ